MARASPSSCQDAPTTNGHAAKKSPPLGPNVREVVLGNVWVKPWYRSYYPEELVGQTLDTLYVCQWCFKYTKELLPYVGHQVCYSKGVVMAAMHADGYRMVEYLRSHRQGGDTWRSHIFERWLLHPRSRR
jgi:hypothetical protein